MTEPTRDLSSIFEEALKGEDFEAYSGLEVPDRARLRAAMLEIAEQAVAKSGSDALERFRSDARAHLTEPANRDRYYNAISAFRTDRDPYFDTQLGEAEQRFANSGAVHLELGTWTAWPVER